MSRVPVDRKTDQVIVRLSKAQKTRWQREADRQRIKLSELIRYERKRCQDDLFGRR